MRNLAILAVAALMLAAIASAAPQRTGARLLLADQAPVKVVGIGFVPLERVRLRATSEGDTFKRSVSSSSTGRFTTVFSTIFLKSRCSADLVVVAIGARGSRATLKLPPPLCPPPLRPPS